MKATIQVEFTSTEVITMIVIIELKFVSHSSTYFSFLFIANIQLWICITNKQGEEELLFINGLIIYV